MANMITIFQKQTPKDMAKSEGTDEELKRTNQLKWVGLMNNYKNFAEEIVYSELIYA